MSTAARIEELLGKFDENPRRYFAPLANEYRKAGDLAQAIALCREHLPKQPGHMSGHIVFGQALFEHGEFDEAQEVFEAALALDPENLIALRHLGDIARQRGDTVGARRWYGRVLDADPRNDDIAALIASLPSRVTPVASAAIVTPAAPLETASDRADGAHGFADEPAWHTPSFLTAAAPAAEAPAPQAPTPEPPSVELLDLDAPLGETAEAPSEAPAAPVEGFAATQGDVVAEAVVADIEAAADLVPHADGIDDALDLAVPESTTVEAFEAVSNAGTIDAALGAFASHEPLELEAPLGSIIEEPTVAREELRSDELMVEETLTLASAAEEASVTMDTPDASVGDVAMAADALVDVPAEPVVMLDDLTVPSTWTATRSDEADALDVDLTADAVAGDASGGIGGDAVEPEVRAMAEDADDTTAVFEEGLLADAWPTAEALHTRPLTPAVAPTPVWSAPVEIPVDAVASAEVIGGAEGGTEGDDVASTLDLMDIEALGAEALGAEALASQAGESEALAPEAVEPMLIEAEVLADEAIEAEAIEAEAIEAEAIEEAAVQAEAFEVAALDDDVIGAEALAVAFERDTELAALDIAEEAAADAPEAPVAHLGAFDGDLAGAVDRAISDDLPYSIESEPGADAPSALPVDEDLPLSAAEMSWLSIEEEEREAEQDVVVLPSGAGADDAAGELVGDAPDGFVTETMAELLVAQGFTSRAIGVYEELVRRRPEDAALVSRLAELRGESSSTPFSAATPISAATPVSSTPFRAATPISATPFTAAKPVSATPVVGTPLVVGAVSATPRAVPLVAPAPSRTAREWLSSLAARRVQRSTTTATPAPGATATAAATPIASPSVSAYETPADGLASLFGDTGLAADADVQAATSLASAFDATTQADGRDLFDEVADAPDVNEAPQPEPAVPTSGAATGDAFSFDRFFPDPARTANGAALDASDEAATTPPVAGSASRASGATEAINPTQELAQFAHWLKGLSNS